MRSITADPLSEIDLQLKLEIEMRYYVFVKPAEDPDEPGCWWELEEVQTISAAMGLAAAASGAMAYDVRIYDEVGICVSRKRALGIHPAKLI